MSKDHNYQKIEGQELEEALNDLPDWQIKSGKLHALFRFKNFQQAFAFITQVALAAEKLDHHPDWSNSYNVVAINLITHQHDALTDYDMKLADQISELYHQDSKR